MAFHSIPSWFFWHTTGDEGHDEGHDEGQGEEEIRQSIEQLDEGEVIDARISSNSPEGPDVPGPPPPSFRHTSIRDISFNYDPIEKDKTTLRRDRHMRRNDVTDNNFDDHHRNLRCRPQVSVLKYPFVSPFSSIWTPSGFLIALSGAAGELIRVIAHIEGFPLDYEFPSPAPNPLYM